MHQDVQALEQSSETPEDRVWQDQGRGVQGVRSQVLLQTRNAGAHV